VKDFFVNIWIIVIIVIIGVVVVGTGSGVGLILGLRGGPAAGSLPTWSEGNQWVYEWSLGTYTGNLTMNVTGQDVDCYTLDLTFDPAMTYPPVSGGEAWVEKDTLLQKKWEMSGTDGNSTYTVVLEWSYDFDKALWPLEVGKEVGVIQTFTVTVDTTVMLNETINGAMKVESKENKPVIAGEFDCFYVVFRDADEVVRTRMWYSDEVKSWVKLVFYDENGDPTERWELKSYSV
jgi:hypothetical protein